ncbi:hypothetical protein RI367_006712 [Sorochytrium milnesiophthora]
MELNKSPIEGITAGPKKEDDMLHWQGTIAGPADTPYKNGKFSFDIDFSVDYPFKPPKVKVTTKIYHPNVDSDGSICVALLKSEVWKPATKVIDILNSLISMISEPNPDDALVPAIAEEYKSQRAEFNKKAQEWTKQYAK